MVESTNFLEQTKSCELHNSYDPTSILIIPSNSSEKMHTHVEGDGKSHPSFIISRAYVYYKIPMKQRERGDSVDWCQFRGQNDYNSTNIVWQ